MAKVERTAENFMHCKCLSCPSYSMKCKLKEVPLDMARMAKGVSKAEHLEGMFCAFSASECITEDKGCKCFDCNLFKKYDLSKGHYCLNGAAE
jgi:hypothetical protein